MLPTEDSFVLLLCVAVIFLNYTAKVIYLIPNRHRFLFFRKVGGEERVAGQKRFLHVEFVFTKVSNVFELKQLKSVSCFPAGETRFFVQSDIDLIRGCVLFCTHSVVRM